MRSEPLPPNRRVRVTGLVMTALAALALVGATTGWDTDGTAERVALGIVGALFLLVGLLLARTRAPAITTLHADEQGLWIGVADRPAGVVPWSDIRGFGVRQLGKRLIPGGFMVSFDYGADVPRLPDLRVFERPLDDGRRRVLLGLRRSQGLALGIEMARLPDELKDRSLSGGSLAVLEGSQPASRWRRRSSR